jgi:hypothetical protein
MNQPEHGSDYEQRDVPARGLALTAIGIAMGIALLIAMLIWLRQTRWAPPPPSHAPFAQQALPPPPRLQTQPQADLARLRQANAQRLHSYGWVDQAQGIAHIPIEQAMNVYVIRASTMSLAQNDEHSRTHWRAPPSNLPSAPPPIGIQNPPPVGLQNPPPVGLQNPPPPAGIYNSQPGGLRSPETPYERWHRQQLEEARRHTEYERRRHERRQHEDARWHSQTPAAGYPNGAGGRLIDPSNPPVYGPPLPGQPLQGDRP